MNFARAGRTGVRFLHNLPLARVSGRNSHHASSLLLTDAANHSSLRNPRSIFPALVRAFADKPAGRPKQHTGRAPARQSKIKSTSTTAKSKAKPKAKAAGSKKTTTKKKKATKTKTAAAKKPKTAEQVEREKAKAAKAKLQSQRKLSLLSQEPKKGFVSAWTAFVMDSSASGKFSDGQSVSKHMPAIATEFKQLSPSDREALNHKASMRTEAMREKHADWVNSLSADAIIQANRSRFWLKSNGGKRYTKVSKIVDPRAPKASRTAYSFFTKARWESGDFKHIKVTDAAKLIAQEFRELPESEVSRYKKLEAEDRERATKEKEAYKQAR